MNDGNDRDHGNAGETFSRRVSIADDDDRRSRDSAGTSSSTNFTVHYHHSDEFHLNSLDSSRASDINHPSSSSNSMVVMNSKQSLNISYTKKKSKNGVRHFLRRIFRSSSHQEIEPALKIDPLKSAIVNPVANEQSRALRLLVLRHGERLDRYYSSQWLRQAFDQDGNYCRFSPILPDTLPIRALIQDFDLDPPLTHKGLKDAYHTGAILKEKRIDIHYCYSSPSLRCIQTAWKILEGLQLHDQVKIRIEPGLFECTSWYANPDVSPPLFTMPRFLTKKELIENKYPIDKNYHEQMNLVEVSQLENELEFYQRSHAITASIIQMHESEQIASTEPLNLHILFVAHAPSLETCTRQLCGGKLRPQVLDQVIRNVDFLTMTVIEKSDPVATRWIFRRNSFYGDEF